MPLPEVVHLLVAFCPFPDGHGLVVRLLTVESKAASAIVWMGFGGVNNMQVLSTPVSQEDSPRLRVSGPQLPVNRKTSENFGLNENPSLTATVRLGSQHHSCRTLGRRLGG
jgi:hypothetical protein